MEATTVVNAASFPTCRKLRRCDGAPLYPPGFFYTPGFRSKVAARFREQSLHHLYHHISVRSRLWSSTGGLCDVGLVRKPFADDVRTRPDILLCVADCYGLHGSNERIASRARGCTPRRFSNRGRLSLDRTYRTSSYIPGTRTWYLVQHLLHITSDEVFYDLVIYDAKRLPCTNMHRSSYLPLLPPGLTASKHLLPGRPLYAPLLLCAML